MKCETSEQYILLEQSGELGSWRRRKLLAHVQACENCRRFREESARITQSARDAMSEVEVSSFAVQQVKRAGREAVRGKDHRRTREPFVTLWRPALIYATLAVLLLAGWFVLSRRETTDVQVAEGKDAPIAVEHDWNGDLDEEIAELDLMIAAVSEDFTYAGSYDYTESPEDLDEIAMELLLLEESS